MLRLNTKIPSEEMPTGVCDYCGQPFPTTDRLILHKGLEHIQVLTKPEREAFMDVRATEDDDLRMLRLKALGMLVFVYFGFLALYAIFA